MVVPLAAQITSQKSGVIEKGMPLVAQRGGEGSAGARLTPLRVSGGGVFRIFRRNSTRFCVGRTGRVPTRARPVRRSASGRRLGFSGRDLEAIEDHLGSRCLGGGDRLPIGAQVVDRPSEGDHALAGGYVDVVSIHVDIPE